MKTRWCYLFLGIIHLIGGSILVFVPGSGRDLETIGYSVLGTSLVALGGVYIAKSANTKK